MTKQTCGTCKHASIDDAGVVEWCELYPDESFQPAYEQCGMQDHVPREQECTACEPSTFLSIVDVDMPERVLFTIWHTNGILVVRDELGRDRVNFVTSTRTRLVETDKNGNPLPILEQLGDPLKSRMIRNDV